MFVSALATGLLLCGLNHGAAATGNQPPIVSLTPTTPTNGVIHGEYVFINADAGDPDGQVVSVEYFIDEYSIGIVSNDPPRLYAPNGYFSYSLITYPPFGFYWRLDSGEYDIRAKATDNLGATAVSDPLHVIMIGPPILNIEATDAQAAESGDPGVFRITRTGETNADLPVAYFIEGNASNGVDYVTIPDSVTIPAGQDSVQIVIQPLDDLLPDGREAVRLRLPFPSPRLSTLAYPPPPPPYHVGANSSAMVLIADDDGGPTNQSPLVKMRFPADGQTVAASPIGLSALASDPDGNLVRLEFFAGTNSIGVLNYSLNPIPIPPSPIDPNQPVINELPNTLDALSLPVSRVPTWNPAPGEYVLTARATDNDGATTVSDPAHVKVVPKPIVTVRATDANAAEPGGGRGPNRGTFTFTRAGSKSMDLYVRYQLGGTAQEGVDYELITGNSSWPASGTVVIPAGQSSVRLSVEPLADSLREGTETVTLTLTPVATSSDGVGGIGLVVASYEIGERSEATVRIRDNNRAPRNHRPQVRIVEPANKEVFVPGQPIRILAIASDADSFVPFVEFFDGADKIGQLRIDFFVAPPPGVHIPFEFIWTNAPPGRHNLHVRATDEQGAIQVSAPVRISVE